MVPVQVRRFCAHEQSTNLPFFLIVEINCSLKLLQHSTILIKQLCYLFLLENIYNKAWTLSSLIDSTLINRLRIFFNIYGDYRFGNHTFKFFFILETNCNINLLLNSEILMEQLCHPFLQDNIQHNVCTLSCLIDSVLMNRLWVLFVYLLIVYLSKIRILYRKPKHIKKLSSVTFNYTIFTPCSTEFFESFSNMSRMLLTSFARIIKKHFLTTKMNSFTICTNVIASVLLRYVAK